MLQTVASGALHAAIIAAAVYATAGAAPGLPATLRDTSMVFLPPDPPRVSTPTTPIDAAVTDAPPKGFQEIPTVLDVPSSIPPVDLSVPFNRDDWTGIGKPGGRHDGVAVVDSTSAAPAFVAGEVDEPVSTVLIPAPRYPPALRAAGIEGEVVVQYVVDTTGLVEPASWSVLRATQDGFREPAREAILAGRFTPARVSGRKVRQLVQQVVRFAMR